MDATLLIVCALILLALCFDFINGFHDAANSIATVVSTRVLTPLQAVVWAAFFNFAAAFGFGVGVAKTVGKGRVRPPVADQWGILPGLGGAVGWRLSTWDRRRPTASVTAPTTRRRPWASSPSCSSARATSVASFTCRSG